MRIVVIDLKTKKDKVINTKYDFSTPEGRRRIERYIAKFLNLKKFPKLEVR